jgi:hypothetical protein
LILPGKQQHFADVIDQANPLSGNGQPKYYFHDVLVDNQLNYQP